eukprot:CAMPEP_0178964244 /NCGR_PEP_ID=MMETSP0789-20121207/15552_1 /TAXON_ID=3005 /ORGANISM="Rhizosolenia setigera, Strain CCMP 1694" /LENGTH=190 /DNA_ID=CAMNT_0020648963 /DNA_START=6 /DNA_END=578 /DNA_ORIENTATION=+
MEHASPFLYSTNQHYLNESSSILSGDPTSSSSSSTDDVNAANINTISSSLLATPRDMTAVHDVLALARSLSSRAALPPFPSQLRGGSLGSLQRKIAQTQKRKNQRLKEEEEEKNKQKELDEGNMDVDHDNNAKDGGVKRGNKHQINLDEGASRRTSRKDVTKKFVVASLSDSDSSSSSEEEETDDEMESE